ncbi:MAG TPA: Asp-tRNA(Asn)/Glu-tRNA(Gln) amidotransferase GatCAB subunit C, partial [Syntrophorhabdaceae bacterium]|nr:Asp-tRNA(Asn)/Glu-tRNA(Gln) amidotransferase GatCAB subunit C [Syntrophorhabdaceae bacterium]
EDEQSALVERLDIKDGDVIFMMTGNRQKISELMGRFRLYLGERYDLIDKNLFKFLWVIDFPLFEYSEEQKRYVACHHPFTASKTDIRQFNGDYEALKSKAYDLVLNGVEIGGGSIRIYRKDEQMEMFKLLNIKEEEAQEKFGFLLEALEMGAPPHGGIAFGFDRILMMLLNCDSIRDVIPFPKTQKGVCLLTDAPSRVSQKQLSELKIRLIHEK